MLLCKSKRSFDELISPEGERGKVLEILLGGWNPTITKNSGRLRNSHSSLFAKWGIRFTVYSEETNIDRERLLSSFLELYPLAIGRTWAEAGHDDFGRWIDLSTMFITGKNFWRWTLSPPSLYWPLQILELNASEWSPCKVRGLKSAALIWCTTGQDTSWCLRTICVFLEASLTWLRIERWLNGFPLNFFTITVSLIALKRGDRGAEINQQSASSSVLCCDY